MSFSALAKLWLRRSSLQLRAASSTSSSAPPSVPGSSAAAASASSSSPPPLPGVSTPRAAHEPPAPSKPAGGVKTLPIPPKVQPVTKLDFPATPAAAVIAPTPAEKPHWVHSIGQHKAPRQPARLPGRQTFQERVLSPRVKAAPPPLSSPASTPESTRCAVFIDSENLIASNGKDSGNEKEMIGWICDYAERQGQVSFVQAYEDVGYMAGIAVAWREQKDLMMAALQHHSVRIRDFSKHHGRDGNDADYLLTGDMLRFAYENPGGTLILASGDGDFLYVVEQLALRGHSVHLLIPEMGGSAKLYRLGTRPHICSVPIASLNPAASPRQSPGASTAKLGQVPRDSTTASPNPAAPPKQSPGASKATLFQVLYDSTAAQATRGHSSGGPESAAVSKLAMPVSAGDGQTSTAIKATISLSYAGHLIGPNGSTAARIEDTTGVKLCLKTQSSFRSRKTPPTDVTIQGSDSQVNAAVLLIDEITRRIFRSVDDAMDRWVWQDCSLAADVRSEHEASLLADGPVRPEDRLYSHKVYISSRLEVILLEDRRPFKTIEEESGSVIMVTGASIWLFGRLHDIGTAISSVRAVLEPLLTLGDRLLIQDARSSHYNRVRASAALEQQYVALPKGVRLTPPAVKR